MKEILLKKEIDLDLKDKKVIEEKILEFKKSKTNYITDNQFDKILRDINELENILLFAKKIDNIVDFEKDIQEYHRYLVRLKRFLKINLKDY